MSIWKFISAQTLSALKHSPACLCVARRQVAMHPCPASCLALCSSRRGSRQSASQRFLDQAYPDETSRAGRHAACRSRRHWHHEPRSPMHTRKNCRNIASCIVGRRGRHPSHIRLYVEQEQGRASGLAVLCVDRTVGQVPHVGSLTIPHRYFNCFRIFSAMNLPIYS